ncbi:MAG: DUF5606 domain-containing protein [Bacteroidaceae bacterium]|nr:DUF5606 domain-containing protein [Bacteroidaceae bacterium]
MINEILTISGKPGLFKLLTRGRGALIVENIDETKKRLPIQATDKIVGLGDISIFTDDKEMPLRLVFQAIEDKFGKKAVEFDYKKSADDKLCKFFGEIIPDYDRERVYPSHMRKIFSWYDLLVKYGENDFSDPAAAAAQAAEEKPAE